MRFRLRLRCQISLIIYENITIGNLFSKPRSKLKAKYIPRQLFPGPARSSAAQIVTLYNKHGVPVKIQRISDSFVQKSTVVQSEPSITAPATRMELHVATPELVRNRQNIIRCTWQTAGLTLDQGGVRLSIWTGQSAAVTGYHNHRES